MKVQVKHQESKTGSSSLRDFIGTLGADQKGLFVSTGGYTGPAKEEVKRTDRRVTLIDRDRFIELLLTHYEEIEPEYTNLIPLKQVYVPTEEP
ncbi:restriction endonuclease [Haloarcula marismortui]|uniref:restriction endonuclease n=1 Tax=Haloarcula marismortui TaxID=2238 RepID=UPI003B8385E9